MQNRRSLAQAVGFASFYGFEAKMATPLSVAHRQASYQNLLFLLVCAPLTSDNSND